MTNAALLKRVNKMKFDMLIIEQDRLMEIEHQIKKAARLKSKTKLNYLIADKKDTEIRIGAIKKVRAAKK